MLVTLKINQDNYIFTKSQTSYPIEIEYQNKICNHSHSPFELIRVKKEVSNDISSRSQN
jgi:hypothetical protein